MSDAPQKEDLFCKQYKPLTEVQKNNIDLIKDAAERLLFIINGAEHCTTTAHLREISLARTKLEECVMWAVKGIANNH